MPAAGLAGDGVARHHRHRDRQEHRQDERERGRRVQRAVLHHGGQERAPWPGGGARWVMAMNTATTNGSAQVSTTLIHVRGRRSSLTSSTLIMPGPPTWSEPAPVTDSTISSSAALLRADRADPQPGPDQSRVERGRVGVADQQLLPVPVLHLPVEQRGHLVGVRAVHEDPAGRRAQLGQVLLQHQPAGVQDPDPGAQLLHLGQQVAGQEDSHPRLVQSDEELPQIANPARVQAVARLVQNQQPRPAHQRGGQPEALPHAQRVGLDRPPAHPGQPDLLQRLVDPLTPGAPGGPPARAGRVEQREVRPARQMRVGGGLLDQRADLRQHLAHVPGHPLAQHLDLAAGGVDQTEQHADQCGLARPVRAEQAVPVALADVEVHRLHGRDGAVAFGQSPWC